MSLEDLKKQIGQRMRDILKDRGISQEKAAKIMGLESQTRMFYYLSGRSCMDYDNLLKFCHAFDVTLDFLFGVDASQKNSVDTDFVSKVLKLSSLIDKVVENVSFDDKATLILEFLGEKSDIDFNDDDNVVEITNFLKNGKIANG